MGIHFTFKHLLQHLNTQLLQELTQIGFCLEQTRNSLLNTSSGTTWSFSFIIFFILQIYEIKIRDSKLNPIFSIYTKYFLEPRKTPP